ncbi:FBD-associated F-box protein [Spatholobus suberectus]|nr:FBD-associated F-box protein [Spatholobus suberectus]
MTDRISRLPDAVLCYILSFLPTKVAVATSVLSNRWKPLWRSVPTLDFDYDSYVIDGNSKATHSRFVHSVCTFILSRDLDQPIQRFCLRCRYSVCDTFTVNAWVTAAAQRRVERLDLEPSLIRTIDFPSAVLSCKTLVDLKLKFLKVNALSSVDFPSLKVLHLDCVIFSQRRHLAELLCGAPNLEDLEVENVVFSSYAAEGKFKRLPKLLRAVIDKYVVPLEVVCNAQFLRIMDEMMDDEEIEDLIPEFHNLTHIEFSYYAYTEYWLDVLEVVKHCPNLQNLSIDKENLDHVPSIDLGKDWPCPQCVPNCISLHLKTCCLIKYTGTQGEFEFAKYIMQNARLLKDMIICSYTGADENKKLEMIKELSFCSRLSSTCNLSFE